MRIAIIEDDPTLLKQIAQRFREEGFAVDESSDGEEGLYLLQEYPMDVAIVDLGLPTLSGLELIQKARAQKIDTPILILTARSRWQEKVEGLEAGADDYLPKPFEMEELLARVRALLRRTGRWSSSSMKCGDLEVNSSSQKVTFKDKPLKLTSHEYKVLEYLVMHAGEVISKRRLHEHIYEEAVEVESNVIEVFIRRLRQKIDPKKELNPIETLRGQGYRLNLERE